MVLFVLLFFVVVVVGVDISVVNCDASVGSNGDVDGVVGAVSVVGMCYVAV